MKSFAFNTKKWLVRVMMSLGAFLGLSSCFHNKNMPGSPPETVYGPPSYFEPSIEVIEDVYGPPPIDTTEVVNETDTIIEEPAVTHPVKPAKDK